VLVLHEACRSCSDPEALNSLISANVKDLELPDWEFRTALHVCAVSGNDVAAQILLSHGANTRAADVNGDTPAHVAAARGTGPVAAVVVASDPRVVCVANKFGRTPAHVAAAAQLNSQTVIRCILDAADAEGRVVRLDHRDVDGNTCLHIFAQCLTATSGALHLFKLLIDSGAPVDVRNNQGQTALDLADNAEIRAVLIDAYNRLRTSGALKFSSSSTFKTPKQITLEIRALAQSSSKIVANTCSSCGKGLVVSLPSQGQTGLFDHRCDSCVRSSVQLVVFEIVCLQVSSVWSASAERSA
jgi:ankyrin repeat protein